MPTPISSYLPDLLESEDLRTASRRTYESNLRVHILPGLGDKFVETLTPAELRAFFADQRRRGIGPGATQLSYRLLSKMYRAAVADEMIPRNPLDAVRAPRSKRKREDPPSSEDVRALAQTIAPEYRTLLLVLAWTGLRIGEAGGLRAENWDPERRRLQVKQQATRHGSNDLKTAAARRNVPVPRWLARTLDKHLAENPPIDGRIFSSRKGGPVNSDVFYPVFRSACRAAGLPKFHPHDLRHHAVSAMLSAGVPPKVVQAIVGHESAKLTLEVYGHVSDDDLGAAADQLDDKEF